MLSDNAVELLVFTCAIESNGGSSLKNQGLGIYGMNHENYHDIWENYLQNKPGLYMRLASNFDVHRIPDEYRLIYDLRFSTAMAMIHYSRVSQSLPLSQDYSALWQYYKAHYKVSLNVISEKDSIDKYLTFINN